MAGEIDELAQNRIERRRHMYARVVELVRATTAMEHAALRPPFLLNGGALVVYLALYGAVLTRAPADRQLDQGWVEVALVLWVAGLVGASIATAKGYLSQDAFLRHRDNEVNAASFEDDGLSGEAEKCRKDAEEHGEAGKRHRKHAKFFIVTSMVLFLVGVGAAYRALPPSVAVVGEGPVSTNQQGSP